MQINLVWDSTKSLASSAFQSAVQQAANILSSSILNNITVNIQVSIGSVGGQPLGSAYAEGGPQVVGDSYSQLLSQLSQSNAQNGLSSLTSNYPVTDPSGGTFEISNAEAKAFGLMSATASAIDGEVGFSTQVMSSPSSAYMVDTALHELAHALGRANGFLYAATAYYLPLDLYTYVSPGKLWNPVNQSVPGYFSTNGGVSNLGYFSTSDVGDFVTTQDAFGYQANAADTLSPLDKTVLMSLGFMLSPTTSTTVSNFLTLYSQGSTPGSYSIADTAANVAAHIDTLQADSSGILWITLTDSNPLTLTYSQFQKDSGVLSLIQGPYTLSVTGVTTITLPLVLLNSNVASVSVADSAANLSLPLALDTLQAHAANIASITLTDSNPLTLTYSQFQNDSGVLSLIQGPYSIDVYGVSAASVPTVLANAHVASVAVTDSSQNISAQLDALQSESASISQISLADSSPISVTATQVTQDAGALGKISGSYALAVSGLPAADVPAAASNSHIASVSVVDSLNNLVSYFPGLLQDSNLISAITLTGPTVLSLNAGEWNAASGLVGKITNASLVQFADTASHLNGLNLAPLNGAHAELSLSLMDSNLSVSGGPVSLLDLQGLGSVSYTVSAGAGGQGTVVSVTTGGLSHAITLQNDNPSQVAILSLGANHLLTASYDYAAAQAAVAPNSGVLSVQTPNGSDLLGSVQRLQFTDSTLSYDLAPGQSGAEAAQLLNAAFGKTALGDKVLAGNLIGFFDNGGTLAQAAADLASSGALPADPAAFASSLWLNAVGSSIPASDLTLFTSDLQNGTFTEASLLALAASTSQNQASANLTGLAQTGLVFVPVTSAAGVNTATYGNPSSDYSVSANPASGIVTVTGLGNTDPLINVQRVKFSDASLAFDLGTGQAAGQAAELVGAAYGSTSLSNKTLVGSTLALFDAGNTLLQAAGTVLAALNFSSPTAFLTTVWQNATGTAIPAGELVTLAAQISSGTTTEAQLLAMAAATQDNQTQINLTGLQTHGLAYIAA
ncbi:MAG: NF038122 family metalloprotease [Betaproteobacteria bacterium]|nr:NF038122 family metalloprotease [Betaproteobacteria bacterium]